MKAIIVTTGKDHPGIIAAVTKELAQAQVNILDLSQTIMGGFFTMIIQADLPESVTIGDLKVQMDQVGQEQKVDIRIQAEDTFNAMHLI